MATQLNWRPDGGIVAFVGEDTLPPYNLPSEATRIHLDGKPAFHVTLIARHVMEPYKDAMTTLWPAIADAAPELPVAQLSPELDKAFDVEKQKTSDRPFINPEMNRQFHVTVANDKGGDP